MQYVVTVVVTATESDDPAMLGASIADAVHAAVIEVPGVDSCDVVGLA